MVFQVYDLVIVARDSSTKTGMHALKLLAYFRTLECSSFYASHLSVLDLWSKSRLVSEDAPVDARLISVASPPV